MTGIHRVGLLVLLCLAVAATGGSAQTAVADRPETVLVTLRAKAGSEAALAKVIAAHWDTIRRLNAVIGGHTTLRSVERGTTTFVEIFTWRSPEIPDHAPPEVRALWDEMNRLVETRDGQPGLSIVEVDVVTARAEP